MLFPPVQDLLFERRNSYKNSVTVSRAGGGKIIFVSLDKVITIYMQLILINISGPMLQSLLKKVVGGHIILATNRRVSYLGYYFENPLKIIFAILEGLRGG